MSKPTKAQKARENAWLQQPAVIIPDGKQVKPPPSADARLKAATRFLR